MRLLQLNLRSLLLYSLVLVLISIPLSLFSIRLILNKEVDESIREQSDQFLEHIKGFEYLGDLETDLQVLDQLSSNINIKPSDGPLIPKRFETVILFDSVRNEQKAFRQLSSSVNIKGRSYILTVRMSLVENDELVIALGSVQLAISILLAIGLLLLNRILSKKLWKPFYKTLDQLKAYELDKNESIPVEKSDVVEFDDLNKTVSSLTKRNREVFLQQKEFIENASHELQTPIAIFQSKLDELMQSPSLARMEAQILVELEATAQRMARLNKNLLLLSRIENEQFLNTENVDVSEVINSQLSVLKPLAQLENINIVTSIQSLHLKTNRTLIEVLLTNLFHNAIRYSPKKEDITITLNDHTLTVSNKGKPLKMDVSKMTERFAKESSDPGSTGLGLAIIKKICDRYFYDLKYAYANHTHNFTIKF
jgi:signal transduction histidine kinase